MSGVYGGTSTLSATLKSASGAAIANRTVSFQLDGSPAGTATTNASGVATLTGVSLGRTPVGTYANRVAAAFAGDTTYGPASATSDLTVTKAPLTVVADDKSKTYGDPNPALTYSVVGLVSGDTESAALKTAPTLSTVAASAGAGTYAISVSGGTSDNYALSYTAGKLTVAKAPLTVKADDKGRAYGADNPALTYTVSGLVNGDSQATALPTNPTLATTATPASAEGDVPDHRHRRHPVGELHAGPAGRHADGRRARHHRDRGAEDQDLRRHRPGTHLLRDQGHAGRRRLAERHPQPCCRPGRRQLQDRAGHAHRGQQLRPHVRACRPRGHAPLDRRHRRPAVEGVRRRGPDVQLQPSAAPSPTTTS